MKIREIMTAPAIQISAEETVEVAARTMAHYNIGAVPVCGHDGRICGVLTDRDMVTRCLAAGRLPQDTRVAQVMSGNVISAQPDMDVAMAAQLMGRKQIRRLPVTENGKLCGMVSLGDMANRTDSSSDAAHALTDICANISTG